MMIIDNKYQFFFCYCFISTVNNYKQEEEEEERKYEKFI